MYIGMGFDPASDLKDAVNSAQSNFGTAGLFMAGLLLMVGVAVFSSAKGR